MQIKINSAVELLKNNQSVVIKDLRLSINSMYELQVTGWSHYADFRNLNKAVCLKELNEVKQTFSAILLYSEDLRRFMENREIEYCLEFDDYGKASITICSEKKNHIKWLLDLK